MNEKAVFDEIGFDTSNLDFNENGELVSSPVPNTVNREVIEEIVKGVLDVQSEMSTEDPTAVPTEEPTSVPTEEPTAVPTEEPTEIPLIEKPISNFSNSEIFESIGLSVLCILILILLFTRFWR